MKDTAILLLAFGGPDSPEAISPFLKNVMRGRAPSPGMIKTIKERYCEIGGKSPITEITRLQAQALQKQLEKKSEAPLQVHIGMRHWHPFIKETLSEITDTGCKKIIAICMTPQRSNYSANGYEKDVSDGLDGLKEKPDLRFVSEWHMNHRFH
ncbi:MAG: ferrochelatase, partial [Nitrospinota bacterium]